MVQSTPTTHDHPCVETDAASEARRLASSILPAAPPTAQADDGKRSYEASRKTSLDNDGQDRPDDAEIPSSSHPDMLGKCDSSRWLREQGTRVESDMPCQNNTKTSRCEIEAAHHMPKSRWRNSRQRVNSIGAYIDQDSNATSESNEADVESDTRPPKRRKMSPLPVRTERASHRGASLPCPKAVDSSGHSATSHSAYNIPSPPPSRRPSHIRLARTTGAKFEEWHLPNATLKRVQLSDGRATFQLQFDWDPCEDLQPVACSNSDGTQSPISRKGDRRRLEAASNSSFTPEEEELLINLKEGKEGLTWAAIHKKFSEQYPERRSQASLQVRYCTKLKRREVTGTPSRPASPQIYVALPNIIGNGDSCSSSAPRGPMMPVDPALWRT